MVEQTPINIQALVDLLNRQQPDTLSEMQQRYPDQTGLLQPGKRLGNEPAVYDKLLVDLLISSISSAKQECHQAYHQVSSRLKSSARFRLGSTLLSSAASGGLVGALLQGASQVALAAGILTFLSSSTLLIAQYIEDYAGGQKSLREIRDRVVAFMTETTTVEGEIKIMELRGTWKEAETLVRQLNAVVAAIRQIQLTM